MAVVAAPFLEPTTSGTMTGLGPLLTVRVTSEPTSTGRPGSRLGLDGIAGGDVGVVLFTSGRRRRPSASSRRLGLARGHVLDLRDDDLWRSGADA